jgi:hypothetical protein
MAVAGAVVLLLLLLPPPPLLRNSTVPDRGLQFFLFPDI